MVSIRNGFIETVNGLDMKHRVYNCTALELIDKIEPSSVDLILTDPPYPEEFIHCYNELAKLAVHALKPGRSCLAMSGSAWMLRILKSMDIKGLEYNWMIAMTGLNGGTVAGRHVCNIRWKPFLWHIKTPRSKDGSITPYVSDEIASCKRDKRFHEWGQGITTNQELIKKFKVPEGGVIVDPFVGGGTNAEAAASLGHTFIGCDLNKECVELSKQRLNQFQGELDI